jgi:hypothetical protein
MEPISLFDQLSDLIATLAFGLVLYVALQSFWPEPKALEPDNDMAEPGANPQRWNVLTKAELGDLYLLRKKKKKYGKR